MKYRFIPKAQHQFAPSGASLKESLMNRLKKVTTGLLTGAAVLPLAITPASAGDDPLVTYYKNGEAVCVANGWGYSSPTGYAPGPSCFHSAPKVGLENLPPALAEVNPNLTEQDLINVENTSVLSPGSQVGKDTYSHQPLTGNEPVSPLSEEMTANFQQSNYAINHWSTGENAGQIGNARYAAHENIPVYTVDSSNPHQNYIWVQSTDGRAIHVPGYGKLMAGKIPLPEWALKDRGQSGDRSVAIYDKATGIWRSMFYFGGVGEDGKFVDTSKNPDTPLKHTEDGLPIYTYASGGYILGKPNFEGLGEDNYWTTLQGGTSSVAGMANELTQIGVDEIRAGEINHVISITAADYYSGIASFPAKQTDGRINAIVSEGDSRLNGSEYAKRYRVSKFSSGKIDTQLNDRYRTAMTALHRAGVITIDGSFNILSSKIAADTDTKVLAKELGLDRAHETHAEFIKRYLAEGDMLQVSEAPLPYAPKTGQRLTLPEDFDVESYADAHGLSEFDRMRLRTIQTRGAILTDRNDFIHAFNLEAAASYAPYAREGRNVYLEDPEIVEKLKGSNSHAFPWQAMVWVDANFTEWEGDTGVKNTTEHWNMIPDEGEFETAYLPDAYYDQVYTDQEVYLDPTAESITPRHTMFHAPWFTAEYEAPQVSHHHDMSWHFRAGSTAEDQRQVLKLNTVGYVKVDSTLGRINAYIDSTTMNIDKPAIGTTLLNKVHQSTELNDKYKTNWYVATVDRNDPIARTDTIKVAKGTMTIVDPLANDEAYFGAKAGLRTSDQLDRSWGRISLIDANGQAVDSFTQDGVTYSVTSDNRIEVDATYATEGYTPTIQYQVLRYGNDSTLAPLAANVDVSARTSSALSAPGTLQTQVFTSFGANAPVVVEPPVKETPEPSPQPTEEPTAEPSVEPSVQPSEEPTVAPIDPIQPQEPIVTPAPEVPVVPEEPVDQPTDIPSEEPSEEPSVEPIVEPSVQPSEESTATPTTELSEEPTNDSSDQAVTNDSETVVVTEEKPSEQPVVSESKPSSVDPDTGSISQGSAIASEQIREKSTITNARIVLTGLTFIAFGLISLTHFLRKKTQ